MMTSLFSIFDPSTPDNMLSNWMSLALFTLLAPVPLWMHPSRTKFMASAMNNYIFKEFSPLIKKYKYFLIGPMALFNFILFNNLLGLAPYVFTASSQLNFTLALSMATWSTLVIYACLNNTSNLLAHLIPQGAPIFLMPFMVLVEVISNLIRPITLAVRLMANIVAGHLLIVLLNSADLPVTPLSPLMFGAKQMLALLEVAVAFIQAYVFSVLVTLYCAENTN